jgi:hypothetical protein
MDNTCPLPFDNSDDNVRENIRKIIRMPLPSGQRDLQHVTVTAAYDALHMARGLIGVWLEAKFLEIPADEREQLYRQLLWTAREFMTLWKAITWQPSVQANQQAVFDEVFRDLAVAVGVNTDELSRLCMQV